MGGDLLQLVGTFKSSNQLGPAAPELVRVLEGNTAQSTKPPHQVNKVDPCTHTQLEHCCHALHRG